MGTEPFELGTEAVGVVYILAETGWSTSPRLLDSTFHSRVLSNIRVCTSSNQLSLGRLLGYELVGSVLLFHLFFFVVVVSSATKRSQHKCRKLFFNSITHCTPVRKLVKGGLTKMEVEF